MRLTVSLFLSVSLLALAAGCDKPSSGPVASGPVAAAGGNGSGGGPSVLSTDPGALKLTPENTKIAWIGSKNDGKHDGGFKQFAGTLELKGDDPTTARVAVEIETESLYSDTPRLTGHLKNPDFFEVSKYPKATFVSTAIKPGGTGGATHTVTGDLTLHGVTKPLTFPATIAVTADTATLTSEFTFNRLDYGINFQPDRVHPTVVVKLNVKAARK
jgi:polyisoprenoid-binding protein YceI